MFHIHAHNPAVLVANPDMLKAAVERADRWGGDVEFGLHVFEPEPNGWIEWALIANSDDRGNYVQGQSMAIAVIRRQPGASVEFHS